MVTYVERVAWIPCNQPTPLVDPPFKYRTRHLWSSVRVFRTDERGVTTETDLTPYMLANAVPTEPGMPAALGSDDSTSYVSVDNYTYVEQVNGPGGAPEVSQSIAHLRVTGTQATPHLAPVEGPGLRPEWVVRQQAGSRIRGELFMDWRGEVTVASIVVDATGSWQRLLGPTITARDEVAEALAGGTLMMWAATASDATNPAIRSPYMDVAFMGLRVSYMVPAEGIDPPLRLYPHRGDGLGADNARRLYPPPASFQGGQRRGWRGGHL